MCPRCAPHRCAALRPSSSWGRTRLLPRFPRWQRGARERMGAAAALAPSGLLRALSATLFLPLKLRVYAQGEAVVSATHRSGRALGNARSEPPPRPRRADRDRGIHASFPRTVAGYPCRGRGSPGGTPNPRTGWVHVRREKRNAGMHVHSQGDQQRKRKLRCSTKREGTFRLLFPQTGGGQRRLSSRAVPGAKGMPRVKRGARTNFGAGAGAGAKLGSGRTLPALGRAAAARTPRSSGMPQPRRGRGAPRTAPPPPRGPSRRGAAFTRRAEPPGAPQCARSP